MAFKSHRTSDEYQDHMEKLSQKIAFDHTPLHEPSINALNPCQNERVTVDESRVPIDAFKRTWESHH
jgi:hypothetical protein